MASVHSPFSFRFLDPFLDFNKLGVGFKQAGGCRMSDVGCRMSDFYKSDVGFLQVGCRILTSRMSDFYKSDVGCRMSDFNKPDVGFLQVGCRLSDF